MVVDNPDIFADKYRVKSARLTTWDYSFPATYFVTICTYGRNNFFGKIKDGQIMLSKIGEITNEELLKTFEIRKNISLITYVIMPNHLHLLMKIQFVDPVETRCQHVSTTSSQSTKSHDFHKPEIAISKWKKNSLGSITNQFKGIVTRRCKKSNLFFSWQTRFYDEIIKDGKQYFSVLNYIDTNISNWSGDQFYSP